MRRSAVIPVWNGRDLLARLLATINNQSLPFDEVIVIDNGSTDGSGDLAREQGAHVERFPQNRGFCAAVNRGMREATGGQIAILNADVELSPEWADRLSRALEQQDVWFATGLLLSKQNPGTIDGTWDLVSRALMPWRAGHGTVSSQPAFHAARTVDLASFTAVLLRRELWERVGELDEQFETYLEDVDFGLRCAAVGLRGTYQPSAVAWHYGSATLGRWNATSVRQMSCNQIMLVKKHLSPELLKQWRWTIFWGQALWGFIAIRHGAGVAWFAGKRAGAARAKRLAAATPRLPGSFFARQEREIFELQCKCGFDWYWWVYRMLTAGEAK